MTQLKYVNIMDLKESDIVHSYGARFEIFETKVHECQNEHDIMVAKGKWLSGAVVNGYFGSKKDWNFQGNHHVTHAIEV